MIRIDNKITLQIGIFSGSWSTEIDYNFPTWTELKCGIYFLDYYSGHGLEDPCGVGGLSVRGICNHFKG